MIVRFRRGRGIVEVMIRIGATTWPIPNPLSADDHADGRSPETQQRPAFQAHGVFAVFQTPEETDLEAQPRPLTDEPDSTSADVQPHRVPCAREKFGEDVGPFVDRRM